MLFFRTILAVLLFFAVVIPAKSQVVGFRLGLNSGLFINELGDSDVPHPDAFDYTSALSSEKFTPQPTIGIEGEILFQVSPMSHFGVELDYSKLKGYNDVPPFYNYYLTPYFEQFQDFEQFKEHFQSEPVAFNTTLFNVAVNWKYFFFKTSPLKPFVKLTGVVSFVGTDYTYKNHPFGTKMTGGYDPETNIAWDGFVEIEPESDVLYSRGTSNSEQEKYPAFHLGGGIGFDYKISEHWSLQVDGTATVINTDIINGVPNFTYLQEDGLDILRHNKRPSLTFQLSVGLVYYIEVLGQSGKGGQGKIDPHRPFFRKK